VTEDADLGMRFARLGYQVGVIEAATFEDAPVCLASWMGQRSRWMKGWMQTLAVFLRAPGRHRLKAGAAETFAALCMMSSLLAGPLFGPFYGLRLAHDLMAGDLLAPPTFGRLVLASLNLGIALFGTLAFILPALLGMRRRGLKASPLLLATPLYLALLSAAAWLALWEWTRKPFVWNKTPHSPRPLGAAQAGAAAKNAPASASAIKARVLSTP
jgi:glycosyltransferase XagB